MSLLCLKSSRKFLVCYSKRSTLCMQYSKLPKGLQKKGGDKLGVAKYLFLVFPATTFCLGVWQYNRRNWKQELLAELDHKVKKALPETLNTGINLKELSEYSKYKVKGTFDNSKELFIGPRSLLDSSGGSGGFGIISSSGEKVGWHVITPFQIENGPKILINRGWVKGSRMEAVTRSEGQIEGPVEIVGILRFTEETSSMTPKNKVSSDRWFSRDIPALAQKLGTEELFLDLDLESSRYSAERGGPLGGQTRISLRNDHAQYMMTWWGLSIGSLFVWAKRFVW